MRKVILARYSEIHLKGQNRPFFERLLMRNMHTALKGEEHKIIKREGRYFITDIREERIDAILSKLQKVNGLHSLAVAYELEKDIDKISEVAITLMTGKRGTFKVDARRSDKHFPMESPEICAHIGEDILEATGLHVDVKNPDTTVHVEIRENAYVYTDLVPAPGGMPVGGNGKAVVLLSGGIDSPVAAWMTAKRGVELTCVYFHAAPFTSELAKQKVIDLAGIVSAWAGNMKLYVVPFTKAQQAIYENCPENEMTIIMRRFMMRIAERIAVKENCMALITGESIGQVASQTLEALDCTNAVCDMPVLRPCIGMDKIEIIEISRKIGTFETSCLPYEDCCTVFTPRHPLTRPKRAKIERSEQNLDIDAIVDEAVSGAEIINISGADN